jgi:DNA-binding MarR family transcriptional regulator
MARALERAGLVERRADPTDARATRMYLTTRAREFRPVAEEILAELEGEAFQSLALPSESLKRALRVLSDLSARE